MRDVPDGDGGRAILAEGLLAGTRIATVEGWCCAESLRPGDMVLTFESGWQPLIELRSACVDPEDLPRAFWPLVVPKGALENREDVLLLPEQKVLIEADCAEALHGDPFAVIAAQALDGWRGIRRARPDAVSRVLTPCFEVEQIIYASRNMLLCCPGLHPSWDDAPDRIAGGAAGGCHSGLTMQQALHLVACLIAEDVGAALRFGAAPPVGWGRQAARAAGAKRP